MVAIGEAGLDYHYDNSPRAAQEQGFRAHIAAARDTGLPLVIHSRDADDDMAAILEEETGKGAFPAVLHCFTGGKELARRAIALSRARQVSWQAQRAVLCRRNRENAGSGPWRFRSRDRSPDHRKLLQAFQ